MSQEVSNEEMKQYLKDANVYEENMPDDLMLQFYKAIKNSETSLNAENGSKNIQPLDDAEKSLNDSANELLEAINNSESIAPSNKKLNETFSISQSDEDSMDCFAQDIIDKGKTRLKEEEANNNNNNFIDVVKVDPKDIGLDIILDIKKTPIGFNDMPKVENVEKNMLKIISHEMKYINVQNSEKFLTSNSEMRIKILSNYHIAAAKLRAHFASLSATMAPIPKPITAVNQDLYVNPVVSSLKEEALQVETPYISRSGRLTKRKVYNYNDYDDSSPESVTAPKKSKGDDDWLSKKTLGKEKVQKIIPKSKESSDHTLNDVIPVENKMNHDVTRSESPDSSQNEPILVTADATIFSTKEVLNKNFPRLKMSTYGLKGRTETLMNAAREETVRKQQQEEEMDKFTKSLDLDSQALEDESEKIIVDDEPEMFEKKRVAPPLPTPRRGIHSKKRGGVNGPEPLILSTKKQISSLEEINSTTVNGTVRKALPKRATNNNADSRGEASSSSGSTRGKKEVNMMSCPLCSVSFPQKEIEEHASTCGEDMFAQTPQPKLSRITCEVCDQVVPLTTDYEVHVKDCIEKKRASENS